MKASLALALVLAAGGVAEAQSLLGEGGGSPYDPPQPPVYRKHDRLRVRFPPAPAAAEAEPEAGRRTPGQLGIERRAERTVSPAPAEWSSSLPVEVADVRPNGVLVVQAVRRRRVNGAEETLRVTGEVSPRDVVAGEVELDRVAHLSVAYEGPATRLPGWLLGAFGRIGPF